MILSDEENKILELLIKGKTNLEIADEIGYSEASVKKRLTKLYKRFQVTSRIELLNKLLDKLHIILSKVVSFTTETDYVI